MLTDYRGYLHGEAVAIGMAFAARLSAARGICAPSVAAAHRWRCCSAPGCRPSCRTSLIGRHLALAIAADKKVAGGKVKFVVIEDIGRVRFEYLSGEEVLAHAAVGVKRTDTNQRRPRRAVGGRSESLWRLPCGGCQS